MPDQSCVPYARKGLYLLITIPMLMLFVLIAIFLWIQGIVFFFIYLGLLITVIIIQSFCCAYQECPYMGKRFCPGIGGFLIVSSWLAKLYKNPTRHSKKTFKILAETGFFLFMAILVFPAYFIFRLGWYYVLIYAGVCLLYLFLFMKFICPVCAIRDTCPGGKSSTKFFGEK